MMITRATEDAIRLLTALANSGGKRMKVADLATVTCVPKNYIFKVLVPLVRRGWVLSTRGFGGGFALVQGAEKVTLLDVVELLEGPLRLNCCTGNGGCEFLPRCAIRSAWVEGEAELRKVLARYDIARLAAGCRDRELFVPIASLVPDSNGQGKVSASSAEPSQ
jgi:Rrf2 family protein